MTTKVETGELVRLMIRLDDQGPEYTKRQAAKLVQRLKRRWPTYPRGAVASQEFKRTIDIFEREEFPAWRR
jgi:hypothetical protein